MSVEKSPTQLLANLFVRRNLQRSSMTRPTDVREAVSSLRDFTGLSHADFARRLLITTGQLTRLEVFGTPTPPVLLTQLLNFSERFHLPYHVAFFEKRLLDSAITKRKSKKLHQQER